jgi:hypothetical protein
VFGFHTLSVSVWISHILSVSVYPSTYWQYVHVNSKLRLTICEILAFSDNVWNPGTYRQCKKFKLLLIMYEFKTLTNNVWNSKSVSVWISHIVSKCLDFTHIVSKCMDFTHCMYVFGFHTLSVSVWISHILSVSAWISHIDSKCLDFIHCQ